MDNDCSAEDDIDDVSLNISEEDEEVQDEMQHAKYDNLKRQMNLISDDEEEIEEDYRQKYEMETELSNDNTMSNTISQQRCLPSSKDAKLWQIRCYIGEEKNTVLKLMHKFNVFRKANKPMDIISVFSKDNIKGYIYIEAYNESDVTDAARDIKSISFGISGIKMVPVFEMTEIIKVWKTFRKLQIGQYVRINKGMYREDLAKMESIDENKNSVIVQLIPRIDYKQLTKDTKTHVKQKFFVKPFPVLLNQQKIAELGLEVARNGKYVIFRNNKFDEHGFLFKDFKFSEIDVHGVKPDSEELAKFHDIDGINEEAKKGHGSAELTFNINDMVVVTKGSLKELSGKVVSIDIHNNIMVYTNELKQNMSFRPNELQRLFTVGNHVRVMGGPHEGEMGIVVKSDNNVVVVLSDNNINQFQVKPMDLLLSINFSTMTPVSTKFVLGDLVQTEPKTVGVVVQFVKPMMKILTNMNKGVMVDMNSSLQKKNDNKSLTLDANKLKIERNDLVDIISGPGTGKHGEVRHIWKGMLFIYNIQFTENQGLLATKGCNVVKKGSGNRNKAMNGSLNSTAQKPRPYTRTDNRNNNTGFKAPNNFNKDRKLIGQNVKFVKGSYKGQIGIIKNIKLDVATIQMSSRYKTLDVSKDQYRIIDKDGKIVQSTSTTPPKSNFDTSALGGQTPSYESMMYDSGTWNKNRYPTISYQSRFIE